MRKFLLFLAAFFLLANGVFSAQAEVDMDLMQTVEDLNKSLASNVATKNANGSKSDAKELEQLFTTVETYFANKGGAEDAVELARKSRLLAAAISKAVSEGNYEAATNHATDLSRACRSCHTFYKKS